MGKHQYRPGQLCDPHDPPRIGMVRLIKRARFVDKAWLCHNVSTHLLSIVTEAQLDRVCEEPAPTPRPSRAVDRAAR